MQNQHQHTTIKIRSSLRPLFYACFAVLLSACLLTFEGCVSVNPPPVASTETSFLEQTEHHTFMTADTITESVETPPIDTQDSSAIVGTTIPIKFPVYYQIGLSRAIEVRWGSPLSHHREDGYPMEWNEKLGITVEILHVYTRTFDYAYPRMTSAEISSVDIIYVPKEIVSSLSDGSESLIFLSEPYFDSTETQQIYLSLDREAAVGEETVYPVFSIQDKKISVSEIQMQRNDLGTPYLKIMQILLNGNDFLTSKADPSRFLFRDGISTEELEEFFYLTRRTRT